MLFEIPADTLTVQKRKKREFRKLTSKTKPTGPVNLKVETGTPSWVLPDLYHPSFSFLGGAIPYSHYLLKIRGGVSWVSRNLCAPKIPEGKDVSGAVFKCSECELNTATLQLKCFHPICGRYSLRKKMSVVQICPTCQQQELYQTTFSARVRQAGSDIISVHHFDNSALSGSFLKNLKMRKDFSQIHAKQQRWRADNIFGRLKKFCDSEDLRQLAEILLFIVQKTEVKTKIRKSIERCKGGLFRNYQYPRVCPPSYISATTRSSEYSSKA